VFPKRSLYGSDYGLDKQEIDFKQWHSGRLSDPPSVISTGYCGLKRSGCETDHSPLSRAEVKNAWSYICVPPCVFIKCRNNLASVIGFIADTRLSTAEALQHVMETVRVKLDGGYNFRIYSVKETS
jgi:hypothetical protein